MNTLLAKDAPLSEKMLTVRLPKKLLALMDAEAKRVKTTRSKLVRAAIEHRIKSSR
jgi:metal-responsive CopG/Arc/MetJ family transcriptional regulator